MDLILLPLAAGMIILFSHAYFGLHVIQRGVIFVDLALAQIAALGGTVAFILGSEQGSTEAYLYSFGFTLLGALIFSLSRWEDSPVPQEAIIGITYVVASAAVILVSSLSAEGTEHVSETLTGSLIWVTWPTVIKVGISYAAILLFHYIFRSKLVTITFSPGGTSHVRWWDFVFFATFGVTITSAVQIAGVLMVFSVLVIPAVIAFFYTRTFTSALLMAWASGTLALLLGLGVSFGFDITTGPTIVCAFGVVLLAALPFRRRFGVVVSDKMERGLTVKSLARPHREPPLVEQTISAGGT